MTGNYNDDSGSVAIVISKADATIVVTGYDVTYDATAHTATGSATGVDDEPLAGLDLSGTTHTNAGDYTGDPWTFTDVTGNYNDASGTVDDDIDKADAVIDRRLPTTSRTTATRTPRPATAKGVHDEALAGLDLTATTHTDVRATTRRHLDLHRRHRQLQRRERHGR